MTHRESESKPSPGNTEFRIGNTKLSTVNLRVRLGK